MASEPAGYKSFATFMGWDKPTYFNPQGKTWDSLTQREQDQYNGMAASKAQYEKARGAPYASWQEFANASPRNNDSAFGTLASGVQSIMPPADVLKAAAIIGGAGYGATTLGGAMGAGSAATPAATGGLTAEQMASPVMASGYTAPAIASAAPVAAGSNTLASLASSPYSSITQGAIDAATGGAAPAASAVAPAVAGTAASSLIPGLSNNALGSLVSGGASLLGANMAANSAKDAAAIQAQSGQAAIDEARRQFDIGQTNQKPWMTGGKEALGAQLDLMGLPGGTTGSSTNALAELQKTPGYQFTVDQGNQAINRSAAAKGMLNSGNVLADLTKYGQDMGSTQYGNRLNQLGSLSGTGQAAASGMANQGANYANQYGNNITGIGNANAAGTIASGNAWQNGILGAGQSLSNFFNPPQQQPSFKLVNGQWSYSV